MNGETMTTLASQAPMTVEELHFIGGLGENVIKEYGERLVKNIKAFVQFENLHEYIAKRPKKRPRVEESTGKTKSVSSELKKHAVPKPASIIELNEDDDEFDVGIDFNAIEIPNDKGSSSSKSPYF